MEQYGHQGGRQKRCGNRLAGRLLPPRSTSNSAINFMTSNSPFIFILKLNPHFGQTKSCQRTIQDLITWQELATSANTVSQHPIISTLRTSRISLKMKIPDQNRPIVSACSRSTERISSCLDNSMTLSGSGVRQRSHFHKRTSQTDRLPQLLISFIFSSTKKEKNKGTEMPLS